jgi:D-proline reductase (dithiol) PrdB
VREVAEKVRPPRSVYLKWPFGSPMGEPGNALQQRRLLLDMLEAVRGATDPGSIFDLGYRWRREDYAAVPGLRL